MIHDQADFWRNIPGTDGKYQASRAGEIRRVLPNGRTRIVKPCKTGHGRVVVNLSLNGKWMVRAVCALVGLTWFGPLPPGMVWHHKSSCTLDNSIDNIAPISRQQLGRKTGGRNSRRRPVEKVDANGNVLDVYGSLREAARTNFMSTGAIRDRIYGRVKHPFIAVEYTFRYECDRKERGTHE